MGELLDKAKQMGIHWSDLRSLPGMTLADQINITRESIDEMRGAMRVRNTAGVVAVSSSVEVEPS